MFDYITCLYDGMMTQYLYTLPKDDAMLQAIQQGHETCRALLDALPREQHTLFFAYESALNAQHALEQARLFRETLVLGRMIYG